MKSNRNTGMAVSDVRNVTEDIVNDIVENVDISPLPEVPQLIEYPIEKVFRLETLTDGDFFATIGDVPKFAMDAVNAAMNKVGVNGHKVLTTDNDGNINLTGTMVRMIVMNYRAGLYTNRR